jgi:transcriptional regulator with XRE-family HTH domain
MDGEARSRCRLRRLVQQKYGSLLDRFYLETDFSKGHLSQILRGTSSPKLSTVEELAKLLGLQLEDLFKY